MRLACTSSNTCHREERKNIYLNTNTATIHLQGYLAHKKNAPTRTLQKDYTQGPTVVLGGHKRGTPVALVTSEICSKLILNKETSQKSAKLAPEIQGGREQVCLLLVLNVDRSYSW